MLQAPFIYVGVRRQIGNSFFVIGHSEYGSFKLKEEYLRDLEKGEKIQVPKNYFKEDNPNQLPIVSSRAHGISAL